ncbi:hypothetical protein ACRWU7_23060 [Escherichia coli]
MLAFSIQYRSRSGWARCGSSGMFLFFGDGELMVPEAFRFQVYSEVWKDEAPGDISINPVLHPFCWTMKWNSP